MDAEVRKQLKLFTDEEDALQAKLEELELKRKRFLRDKGVPVVYVKPDLDAEEPLESGHYFLVTETPGLEKMSFAASGNYGVVVIDDRGAEVQLEDIDPEAALYRAPDPAYTE